MSKIIHNYVLPVVTRGNYNPNGVQALTSVKLMPEGLKVHVSYQKDDPAVGNVHDQKFAEELIARLRVNNVWIILGNDGGKPICNATWAALVQAKKDGIIKRPPPCYVPVHNAGHFMLENNTLNAFFAMLDCSYYHDEQKMVPIDFFNQFQSQRFTDDLTPFFKDYSKNEYKVDPALTEQLQQEKVQQVQQNKRRWLQLSGVLFMATLLGGWYNYCCLR